MQSVRASELIGLPVLSREKFRHLGHVREVLFCRDGHEVCGLRLDGSGWLHPARILDFKAVQAVEETHVIAAETWLSEDAETRCERDLLGMPVLVQGGEEAGVLDDLQIDPKTGRVIALQLTRGLVDDLILGKALLPVTAELYAGEAAIVVDGTSEMSGGTY